jgi:hypothetical protein
MTVAELNLICETDTQLSESVVLHIQSKNRLGI